MLLCLQAGAEEAVAAHQPPVGTPPGAGLALALPPSTAAAAEGAAAAGDPPRRWSLDLASSTHSDWELLSAGHDSHCGSSPRSVSPSDAYDSEGEAAEARAEAEAEAGAEAAAEHAAPQLDAGSTAELGEATAAAAAAAEDASAEPEVGPEGVPTAQLVLAPAAMAEAPGTDIDSPRSSYERTSSLASGHDLYSLSQVCVWCVAAPWAGRWRRRQPRGGAVRHHQRMAATLVCRHAWLCPPHAPSPCAAIASPAVSVCPSAGWLSRQPD